MAKKSDIKIKKEKINLPVSGKKANVEKILVENFVSLQKVMTNLAVKFDNLSTQISKLLELFEISAKTLAEKDYSAEDRKIKEKLDDLLSQNKIIARGVALLHEKEHPKEERMLYPKEEQKMPPIQHKPIMPMQNIIRKELPKTMPEKLPESKFKSIKM